MAPLSQISIDHFGWQLSYKYISYVFIALLIFVSFLPWKKISSGSKNNPRKTKDGRAVGGVSLKEQYKQKHFGVFSLFFVLQQ